MWLTSTVTHFLTDVRQGTSPNFSKGWCTRELTRYESAYLDIEENGLDDMTNHLLQKRKAWWVNHQGVTEHVLLLNFLNICKPFPKLMLQKNQQLNCQPSSWLGDGIYCSHPFPKKFKEFNRRKLSFSVVANNSKAFHLIRHVSEWQYVYDSLKSIWTSQKNEFLCTCYTLNRKKEPMPTLLNPQRD